MAQRWTRIWEGSGATTLAERMVCPLWAAVLGNGTQVDADNRMFTNPLTGEPDAGNPHVRFGGRGKVNPLSLPYPDDYVAAFARKPHYWILHDLRRSTESPLRGIAGREAGATRATCIGGWPNASPCPTSPPPDLRDSVCRTPLIR